MHEKYTVDFIWSDYKLLPRKCKLEQGELYLCNTINIHINKKNKRIIWTLALIIILYSMINLQTYHMGKQNKKGVYYRRKGRFTMFMSLAWFENGKGAPHSHDTNSKRIRE